MEETFPVRFHEGKDYVRIDGDVFFAFFKTVARYKEMDRELVDEVIKLYKFAKTIRKKRIRLKKEKEALAMMYYLLFRG